VKLLFDKNLPPRLPRALADLYPDSVHVRDCGLASADDSPIWLYAKDHGLTIVSRDSDFQDRSVLYGHPPKFVWVRAEKCSTRDIESLLRAAAPAIEQFIEEDEESYLVLGPRRRPASSRSKK
jgi:predicted nuclease of predicted toxin-antitoxin system